MNFVEFIISCIVEIYMILIMLICYKNISNKELIINKIKFLTIIIFAITIIINNLYCPIYFRLIFSILLSFFINKIIFKNNVKDTFYYTTTYFIISFILELLLVPIVSILDIENIALFNKYFMMKHIFSIILSICILIVFKNKIVIKKLAQLKNSIENKISFLNIIIVSTLFLNIITIMITKNLDNNYIIMLAVSSSTFIIITYKFIIDDKYNILELKMYNENLKSSSKAYSNTIDECRELKHNLKNDLIGIKSFVPMDYHNEINELILNYNKRYEWISKIDDIPEGIQGVIYLKSNEAKKKHIKMFIDVKENIKNINKDYFELSSILGIVLDNAIENSKDSKEKVISVYINSVKNKLNIEIINTFSNKVDLDKLGNKNYSTKKEKSGIGLNYIKGLKKRNIKVKYEIINNLFKTNITYNY